MSNIVETLNPGGQPDMAWGADFAPPRSLEYLDTLFNLQGLDTLLNDTRRHTAMGVDPTTGVAHATYRTPGDSRESLLVHIHPYANGMSDNMLLRGKYLSMALRHLGVRDENGRTLAVMSLAAPSKTSDLRSPDRVLVSSNLDRRAIREGDFSEVADIYLRTVLHTHRRVGKVGLMGFSFGGSVVTAAPRTQTARESMDITHMVAGEPVNNQRRTRARLLGQFAPEANHLKQALAAAGIEPFERVHDDDSLRDFVKQVAASGALATNMAIYKGMSRTTFVDDLLYAATSTEAVLTIGAGTDSKIAPVDKIEAAVQSARVAVNSPDRIHMISISGTHSWGDRINQLATFYAYGLSRTA